MTSKQPLVDRAKNQAQSALRQLDQEFWEKLENNGGNRQEYFDGAVAPTQGDLRTIQAGRYGKGNKNRDTLVTILNSKVPNDHTAASRAARNRNEEVADRDFVYGIKPDPDCRGWTCGTTGLRGSMYDSNFKQPTEKAGSHAKPDTPSDSVRSYVTARDSDGPFSKGYHNGEKLDRLSLYETGFGDPNPEVSVASGPQGEDQGQKRLPQHVPSDQRSYDKSVSSQDGEVLASKHPWGTEDWLSPDY